MPEIRINTPNPETICLLSLPTIAPNTVIAVTAIPRLATLDPNSAISPGIAWFAYSKLLANTVILPAISTRFNIGLVVAFILLDKATMALIPNTTPPIRPILAANPPRSSGIES